MWVSNHKTEFNKTRNISKTHQFNEQTNHEQATANITNLKYDKCNVELIDDYRNSDCRFCEDRGGCDLLLIKMSFM